MFVSTGIAVLALLSHPTACHPFVSKRSAPPVSSRHVPLRQHDHLESRQTGLTGGPYYYGDFNMGGTAINAIVDTGSSDLVVRRDVAPSSSWHDDGSGSCSENYGGRGAISGQKVVGTYHFAEYDIGGHLCLLDQTDGDANFQAVLGLGFPGAAGMIDGPLNQFAERGLTSFSLYLATQRGGGGVFTVNGYNPAYIAEGEDFIYESRLQNSGHWAFPLAGSFDIAGTDYQWGGTNVAVVDSGTPTIRVPASAASAIWQAVGANPDGTYNDCNPGGDPITFASPGGNGFTIEAVHYVIPNGNGCRNAFTAAGPSQQQFVLLGTPFMKQYYTYFDKNNQEMGFVKSGG